MSANNSQLPVVPAQPEITSEWLLVDAQALHTLLNFIAQAPLPMGRDALVQAVIQSARPAQISE